MKTVNIKSGHHAEFHHGVESILVSVQMIGPAEAAEMLATQKRNRKVRPRHMKTLVRDMERGDWSLTAAGIVFDANGCLIDGQHRLTALIQSGKTYPFFVFGGFRPAVQDSLDLGAGRTVWEQMGMDGVANANVMVAYINAIAKGFVGYENKVSLSQARAIAEVLPLLTTAVKADNPKFEFRSATYLGMFALALHLKGPGVKLAVGRLYDAFTRGIGIDSESHPAYRLREFARGNASFGGQQVRIASKFCCDCIHAAVTGEKLPPGRNGVGGGLAWLRGKLPEEFSRLRRILGMQAVAEGGA